MSDSLEKKLKEYELPGADTALVNAVREDWAQKPAGGKLLPLFAVAAIALAALAGWKFFLNDNGGTAAATLAFESGDGFFMLGADAAQSDEARAAWICAGKPLQVQRKRAGDDVASFVIRDVQDNGLLLQPASGGATGFYDQEAIRAAFLSSLDEEADTHYAAGKTGNAAALTELNALALLGSERAAAHIVALAGSESPLAEAASKLRPTKQSRNIDLLAAQALTPGNPYRDRALQTIGRSAGPLSAAVLLRVVDNADDDTSLRLLALRMLAAPGYRQAWTQAQAAAERDDAPAKLRAECERLRAAMVAGSTK